MKSLSLNQPHAIIMVGIPGSGKTFFAEKFAATFNAPYLSYHAIARLVPAADEKAIHKLMNTYLNELFKARCSIVLEGVTDTRAQRSELAKKVTAAGYVPLFVWVQTDSTTAKVRATAPKKSQSNRKLTGLSYDTIVRRFSAPHENEKAIVISGKHTYATQARVILKRLSAPRANISTHATPPTRQLSDIRRSR